MGDEFEMRPGSGAEPRHTGLGDQAGWLAFMEENWGATESSQVREARDLICINSFLLSLIHLLKKNLLSAFSGPCLCWDW